MYVVAISQYIQDFFIPTHVDIMSIQCLYSNKEEIGHRLRLLLYQLLEIIQGYRRAHYRPFLTSNPALSSLSLKALAVKMVGSKLSH